MLHISHLPSEVLGLICGFSENALKDLRLTNVRISEASTPLLFRSVTLVPHAASFANLLALSRSALARHVRHIAYDVRMLSSIPDIKMAFEANEFTLVGDNIEASRKKVFALLDDYENQALNSVDMTEVEINHLLQILPKLPSLEHITITSGSLDELPSFYRKLKTLLSITSDYYFETSNQSGHHTRSVLLCLAALDFKIPGLSFIGIDWSEVVLFRELRTPVRYLTILQRVFRSLPKETLPLPMFLFLYTGKEDDRGVSIDDLLPVIATALDDVQYLTLSMATSRSERQLFMPTGPAYPLSGTTSCASLASVLDCVQSSGQLGPRNLRSLMLTALVIKEALVDDFLHGCRDTLVTLSIGDVRIYLPSSTVSDDATVVEESCLVDVLEMISRKAPNLRRVSLFGRFYNGGSQDWTVSNRKKGSLRTDVERWMVEGGTCPLESERVKGGFQGMRTGDPSFKISRRALEDGADDETDYDFPPTSENELLNVW